MLPHFNSRPYGSSGSNNTNIQINGANASAPQQVMGNQGNFCPNPAQFRAQFPMGMISNPQLPMMNPNPYFAPGQFFPFPHPQGSFLNMNTDLAHIFARNSVNQPQFLPNGMPNLAQNINQLLQMQIPNGGPNNPGPFMNAQLGVNNVNGPLQSVDSKGDFVSPQAQQNHNLNSPGAPMSQGNFGKYNGVNDGKNNERTSQNSNFMNQKNNASQRRSGKQFHHQRNARGNHKFNNEFQGKGNTNNGPKNNFSNSSENSQVGKKRSLVLNYTEQEIRQWREQRKKNYPSIANSEKKSKEKSAQPETTDEATIMRRQQLKEILAKQAELGCEVAEIPSSYLSDSEQQPHGRQQNSKSFGQRGRFQNKFNRNAKFQQTDRFSKRQRFENNHPSNLQSQNNHFANKQRSNNGGTTNPHRFNKSEPSLLKKLLSSDIKRDKKHLLQVFRFMVMNSFFQNTPDKKALKFPAVIVKELNEESKPTEEEEGVVTKGDTSNPLSSACVDHQMLGDGDSDGSNDEEHGEEGEIPPQVDHKAIE